VTLGVDREIFAVPVTTVQEILAARDIARLPNAPPFLLGLIDVRGHSVPVVDLRIKLGLPAAETTEQTRILVLDIDTGAITDDADTAEDASKPARRMLLGLLADRVFEVTALDAGSIEPPPEIGTRWRSDYIRCVGRRDSNFVIVFNLARLLTGEETALIDGRVAA
jgi:purine-binding chemotaxis protein CheW